MKDEDEVAIKQMKSGKAIRNDCIAVEMLRALENVAIEKIITLANKMYETIDITEQMCRSVFIPMKRKLQNVASTAWLI